MTTQALAVVSAGLSVPSSTRLLADRLAAATAEALRERGSGVQIDATVEVVELREHARDLADNLLTGFPNVNLRAALDTVVSADGLIAVTPIFSASYSGCSRRSSTSSTRTRRPASPCSWMPPPARRGTRWRSTTRCGRCSPTCVPSSSRPRSSRRPRTGAPGTPPITTSSGASSAPPVSSPT
jgi:hypothetical protein